MLFFDAQHRCEFLLLFQQCWVMMRITPPPIITTSAREQTMKDIYELIRQKEADLDRIQREIDALRLSAKLLEESGRTSTLAASSHSTPAYAPAPKPQPPPIAAPTAWASAKQFP